MTAKLVMILALFPILSYGQSDSSGKRPDFTKVSPNDIKWTKAEGNSFWFYYKPTQYFFKTKEFETITLENGDILTYLFEMNLYLLLPDYLNTKPNVEQPVEYISNRGSVFVRLARGGFKIYDQGLYIPNVERIGINSIHQYLFRSRISDKRYWVEESDFVNGRIARPVGILSE